MKWELYIDMHGAVAPAISVACHGIVVRAETTPV